MVEESDIGNGAQSNSEKQKTRKIRKRGWGFHDKGNSHKKIAGKEGGEERHTRLKTQQGGNWAVNARGSKSVPGKDGGRVSSKTGKKDSEPKGLGGC